MTRKYINQKANEILKEIYLDKGIVLCEPKLERCMRTFALSFHHLHKRVWYYEKPELLSDFNQTILTCAYCHRRLEYDRELHKEIFKKLRLDD